VKRILNPIKKKYQKIYITKDDYENRSKSVYLKQILDEIESESCNEKKEEDVIEKKQEE